MRFTISIPCALLIMLLAFPWTRLGAASAKFALQFKDGQHSGSDESGWQPVDAGAFWILAPTGWKFQKLQGIDSYVGEFTGNGIRLEFDFGRYSYSFEKEKKPAYVVVNKSIGGLSAKIVSPKTPGRGFTGIYFPRTFGSNKLSLFGQSLTSSQQELVLRVFDTIQFRNGPPKAFPGAGSSF